MATFLFVTAAIFLLALQSVAQDVVPAEYDAGKPVVLMGAVTKMARISPRSRIYMDAKKPNGGIENWAVEVAHPETVKQRLGPRWICLPAGEIIKVDGFRAKDGALRVYGRDITFPDGIGFRFGNLPNDPYSSDPVLNQCRAQLELILEEDNTLAVGQMAVMHIPSDNQYSWVFGKNAAWRKELALIRYSKNEVIFRAIHPGRLVIILSATGPSGCISCATHHMFIDVVPSGN